MCAESAVFVAIGVLFILMSHHSPLGFHFFGIMRKNSLVMMYCYLKFLMLEDTLVIYLSLEAEKDGVDILLHSPIFGFLML